MVVIIEVLLFNSRVDVDLIELTLNGLPVTVIQSKHRKKGPRRSETEILGLVDYSGDLDLIHTCGIYTPVCGYKELAIDTTNVKYSTRIGSQLYFNDDIDGILCHVSKIFNDVNKYLPTKFMYKL